MGKVREGARKQGPRPNDGQRTTDKKGVSGMHIQRSFTPVLLAVAVTVGGAQSTYAADEKTPAITPDQKAFDTKLRRSLFDLVNRGVDLYNAGDWAACYHLF